MAVSTSRLNLPPSRYSHVFPEGAIHPGLHAVLRARRKKLLHRLDSFALFSGVPHVPGEECLWHHNPVRIFQEPALLYLTGINQPGIILCLHPKAAEPETLYIPLKDSAKEFWEGFKFGFPGTPPGEKSRKGSPTDLSDLRRLTGIRNIRPAGLFDDDLSEMIKLLKKNHFYVFFHRYQHEGRALPAKALQVKTDFNFSFYRRVKKRTEKILKTQPQRQSNSWNIEIKSAASMHLELRLPLDTHQLSDVKNAVSLTQSAFRETAAAIRSFRTEHEAASCLNAALQRRSVFGLSFPSIVAAGKNAGTLHYTKNDDRLRPGQLLLMDFGLKYGLMNSDISRTIPVSGRFNPLQSLLYDLVLATQKRNQRNARAGITIREMNRLAWEYLEKRLESDFFARGGTAARDYSFQPHGISHLIGIQVHDGDPFRCYQDTPLQRNMLISNEPGLYGHFTIRLNGKTWSEHLGIRIEDNLLIQKDGCINLSSGIPRERKALESLMSLPS